MSKKSIRFFNDREVRAVWDDENNCWWFSATDVVRAINDEPDYTKAGNYWRWLKRKLGQEGIQLVSATHGFKFEAPDGKQRKADVLNSEGVVLLAKHYPNNRASKFLDWFTYSDNTIDGQSRKKAYTLFESGLLNSLEPGSMKCLQQIHAYLFGGLYDFAGQIRNKNISKGGFTFANCLHFPTIIPTIERMPETTLDEIADKYVEMNVVHPFMDCRLRPVGKSVVGGSARHLHLSVPYRMSCVRPHVNDSGEYHQRSHRVYAAKDERRTPSSSARPS